MNSKRLITPLALTGWLFLRIFVLSISQEVYWWLLTGAAVAILFAVYATGELTGGSGALASFTFGLILGNHGSLERRLSLKSRFVVDERIRQF